MTHCRISRVKFKNGLDLAILPRDVPSQAQRFFRLHVDAIAGLNVEACGFFIVTPDFIRAKFWRKDGDGHGNLFLGQEYLYQEIVKDFR